MKKATSPAENPSSFEVQETLSRCLEEIASLKAANAELQMLVKRSGKREEDLSGLLVERIDYELAESERTCFQCGEVMGGVGVDVRQELALIPAKVIVVEHAAHAYV